MGAQPLLLGAFDFPEGAFDLLNIFNLFFLGAVWFVVLADWDLVLLTDEGCCLKVRLEKEQWSFYRRIIELLALAVLELDRL